MKNAICHPDRKLQAHGLCGSCYTLEWKAERIKNPEWREKHLEVRRNNYARRKKENPERESEKARIYLLKQYNLTLDDYNKMAQSQDFKCQICRNEEFLHVDHDHNTGKVRGLLCRKCNTGLGLFQDSDEFLQLASEYLRRTT